MVVADQPPVRSTSVVAHGSQAERAAAFARRARDAFGHRGGVEVEVREAIPPHVGLGSGTKLGLAIARGVAELAGVSAGPEAAGGRQRPRGALQRRALDVRGARAGGRGRRAPRTAAISPLVARHPMPERWRCVLALPVGDEGLSGDAEERFFDASCTNRAAASRASRGCC